MSILCFSQGASSGNLFDWSKRLIVVFIVATLFLMCLAPSTTWAAKKTSDVRVLVDISGSMKKNDPQNLRIPAINLLANMMPAGAEVGVWTFARYVNMLIKHGPVDSAWKEMATEKSVGINSVGMYTDIGEALDKALASWGGPDENKDRSLILLTDGMVDVSKDPTDSARSRERIVDELIPKLKAANVKVHTIALSGNADKELLQTLSISTDGLFSVIASSDDLLKTFLQAFDQSVEQDEVPLEGNKFTIDTSVEEFTVLAFTLPGAEPSQLVGPKGTVYTKDNNVEGLNWFHDGHYDLITITAPSPGEWTLVAEVDPANRVTVISDLELKMEGLPTNIINGDELVLTISLENEGQTVVQPEFLSLIDLTFRQEFAEQDKVWEGKLTSSREGKIRTPKDGKYSAKIGKTLLPGTHEFSVVLDGRTFQRKRNHRLTVHGSLVDGLIVEQETDDGVEFFLNIVPIANMVNTKSVELYAEISTPQENSIEVTPTQTDFGTWRVDVPPTDGEGLYRVYLRVVGETSEGRAVDLKQLPILVPYQTEQVAQKYKSTIISDVEEPVEQGAIGEDAEPEVEDAPEEDLAEEPDPPSDEEQYSEDTFEEEESFEASPSEITAAEEPEEEPVSEESDWLKTLLLWGGLVIANLLLFVGGFFLYRKISKSNAVAEQAAEANLDHSLNQAKAAGGDDSVEENVAPVARSETKESPAPNDDGVKETTHVDGVDLESDLSDDSDDFSGIESVEIDANDDDDDMSLATNIEDITDLGDDDLDASFDLSDTSDIEDKK